MVRVGQGLAKQAALTYVSREEPPSFPPPVILSRLSSVRFNNSNRRIAALLGLAALTGCHGSEAARLLPADVRDLDPKLAAGLLIRWRAHKTDPTNTEVLTNVIVHPTVVQLLRSVRQSTGRQETLFSQGLVDSCHQWINDFMAPTGLTVTGHVFGWRQNRHAVVTFVAGKVGDIGGAQVVTHHRSSRTTRRYLDAPLQTDLNIAGLFSEDH